MSGAHAATPVAAGAILPHAPLLVEGVAGPGLEPELEPIRSAARAIDLNEVDAIVVLSPHGRADGVYTQSRADLARFGVSETEVTWRTDAGLVKDLAVAWDVEILDDDVDHGVAVPIALSAPRIPVIGACLAEDPGSLDERSYKFAAALSEVVIGHKTAFVASVNTSAGLSPRAPLTEIDGARMLEVNFRKSLETDAGGIVGVVHELASTGGSCGTGPLLVFAALFAGSEVEVLAHTWPVGVGYMVAAVRT
jgi:catalytic LigB subunit of aromatic ring-opening dioxygenase